MRKILGTAAVAGALTVAASGALVPTTASAVPAPAVPLSPAVYPVAQVYGATSDGDVFFNGMGNGPQGQVRRADGSVVSLGATLDGRGEVGPDDRLWLPLYGGVRAYAADGTHVDHPVGGSGAAPVLNEVRIGVDGRAWFVDKGRDAVGSMALDGTGATEWEVPGTGTLSHLGRGLDGRMWIVRTNGALAAITPTGTITTYGSLGSAVEGLASNPSGLFAAVQGKLLRIDGAGKTSAVATPNGSVGGIPVESQGWIWIGTTAISPSGRVAQYGLPIDFDYLGGGPLPQVDARRVTYAASRQGGFVGSIGGSLVRYANPDIGRNVVLKSTVVEVQGVRYLRLTGTARTPGGQALSGTFAVRMEWDRFIPDGFFYYQNASKQIGTMTITGGRGSLDIPVTSTLIAGTTRGFLDHGSCCGVYLLAPATPQGPGLASRDGGVGDSNGTLEMSSTMQWLDRMNGRALARPMDSAGSIYWAQKLATGTPRAVVTKSVVDSTAWRRQRVASAYQRWLGRKPDAAGLDHWQNWLKTHTTSELDFQLGTTAAGRDAGGTSNIDRGKHLASALRLASASATSFTQQLQQGTSWSALVRSAYFSRSAVDRRMADLAPRSSFTPSPEALSAEFRQARDERGPLVKALATMP